LLVETKPEVDFCRPENADKWKSIKKRTKQVGIGFAWMGEKELFRQPRFDNITLLQLYRACAVDRDVAYLLDQALAKYPVVALKDLQRLPKDPLLIRDTVLALIVHRYFWTDLDRPLGEDSLIQKVTSLFPDKRN